MVAPNKYAIYSNSNANALDIQIEPSGGNGSFRVMNGLDARFKIDYLGNTIFSGSNVGFANCISFGDATAKAAQTMCMNSAKTGLDMSGQIRMTGNLQLNNGIGVDGVGPLIEKRDLSDRFGISTTSGETRMYAGTGLPGNKVSLGFADASGYTGRLVVPQSGAATFAGDMDVSGKMTGGQLSSSGRVSVGPKHSFEADGDMLWLRGGALATSRFVNAGPATFQETADFKNGLNVGGANLGTYGQSARFHGASDAVELSLGFRGPATSAVWDDRVTITNSPKRIDIKGDLNLMDGGTLNIGAYKLGVIDNKLTIRDGNGKQVWSVPA